MFWWIFFSTIAISLIAFTGALFFFLQEELLEKIVPILVSFSAGVFIGVVFFHLLAEALKELDSLIVFSLLILGFSLFLLLEKIIRWRHCHEGVCNRHPFTYLSLIGDSVHNFIDGIILAASFIISIPLGIATTISVAAHEIPQEIGELWILIYGGFTKKRALILNFLTALTIVIGGVLSYFLLSVFEKNIIYLLPIIAGNFLYIATSDLIPETHKETEVKKSFFSFLVFLLGILIMLVLKITLE